MGKGQAPEKVNQMKMKDWVPQKMVPREMPLRKVQVLRKTKRADMNKMKNWIQQMKPLRIQQMKPVEMKRQAPEKMNQMKMKDRVPQKMVTREMPLRKVQVLRKTKRAD